MITVSIAYVSDQAQYYQELQVAKDSRICDVINQSGYLSLPDLSWFVDWYHANQYSKPNHKAWYIGIYGVKQPLDALVCDGERIEIYRPLSCEPMARRKRKSKRVPSQPTNILK